MAGFLFFVVFVFLLIRCMCMCFSLPGKQDYKKTKPALKATRLKAEAKKNSSGFRVKVGSLHLHPICPPLFPSVSPPAVFCLSDRNNSVPRERNNAFPPASRRRCIRFPLKNIVKGQKRPSLFLKYSVFNLKRKTYHSFFFFFFQR